MIIDKYVKIYCSGINTKHLKSLGYEIKNGDILEIPVEHLSKCSHRRINCICDICGNKRSTTYQDYNIKIEYDGKYYCCECMKEKRKTIVKNKYGVDNVFQLKESIDKADKTRLEKYGNHKYRNDEKRNKTILKNYGCVNVFQNEKIKEKSCQTNIKNLGVSYPQQNKNVFERSLKKGLKIEYWNEELYSQGSYEKDFLKHCNELNIIHLISKPKSIEYFDGNNKCYYHSDFYMKSLNLIIEIKSSYWMKKLYELNKLKEKSVISNGFNFLLILDKNYSDFDKMIYDIPV